MSNDSKEKDLSDIGPEPMVVPALDDASIRETGQALASNPHRGLRMRHVQLIAISGAIGQALFISIGNPLTSAGPLGLLIGVGLWSIVVWTASNCLIEMTCLLPIDGGFIALSSRFVDKSFAMALGWNYLVTQWALICFEFQAMNIVISYWNNSISPAICIAVGLFLLGALNLYSVRWYGEFEFYLSITKIFLMAGLTLYTFITMVGGNPLRDVYGFRYWKIPGPFGGAANPDFKSVIRGIFDAVSWSTFAIVGPDYISLIAGEVQNPRRVLPKAFNSIIYRLVSFYMVGALCVGICAAADDPSLLGAISAGAPGAAKSPYVISMNRLGIPVLPSIVNAFILISIFSTTNSFVFAASRALLGLAQQGQAPKVFNRLNRNGIPYLTVLLTLSIGLLSFLSLSSGTVKVLNWWINFVTAAQLISWTCIAIVWLRFNAALKAQNLRSKESNFLPARGYLQPFSAIYLLVWSPIVLFFSGYYLFYPGAFSSVNFIFAYGSVFLFLAIYMGAKLWDILYRRASPKVFIAKEEVDLKSGLDEIETMTAAAEEKRASKPRTKGQRVSDFFF